MGIISPALTAIRYSQALRNFLKKYMPAPHTITENRWLAKLGPRIKDPNLWHLNRRSVSAGIFVGVLCAFIPLPVQIFIAVSLCFMVRGNLPLAIGASWISNPLTYIPIFYFCYGVGGWILGVPTPTDTPPAIAMEKLDKLNDFARIYEYMVSKGWHTIGTLLMGCLVVGLTSAVGSYLIIRLWWRLHIYQAWSRRRERHKERKKKTDSSRSDVS